ncbi:MAG TPA: GlsB/YeaQ/YmgE family stress response membrane protein [Aeromicrobium sp.]|nr:GlsB/YeaQ/YmgE family stress response membrane protein [Aeromicrobium sp.]
MELLWAILLTLVLGFLAGLIARALVPGKDAMGLLATALLGIVGSFVGGAVWALFQKDVAVWPPQAGGLLLSILGAVIALLIYNRVAGRKLA